MKKAKFDNKHPTLDKRDENMEEKKERKRNMQYLISKPSSCGHYNKRFCERIPIKTIVSKYCKHFFFFLINLLGNGYTRK